MSQIVSPANVDGLAANHRQSVAGGRLPLILVVDYPKNIARITEVPTEWGFLTNHGRALLCIARDPDVRLREIAQSLNITERSAYAIVNDLTTAGYVIKKRDGRRNRYAIQQHRRLAEPTLRERTIGEVVALLADERPARTAAAKKTTRAARSTLRTR